MPANKCSSDYNGCAACSPSIELIGISVETSYSMDAFGCLNNTIETPRTVYLMKDDINNGTNTVYNLTNSKQACTSNPPENYLCAGGSIGTISRYIHEYEINTTNGNIIHTLKEDTYPVGSDYCTHTPPEDPEPPSCDCNLAYDAETCTPLNQNLDCTSNTMGYEKYTCFSTLVGCCAQDDPPGCLGDLDGVIFASRESGSSIKLIQAKGLSYYYSLCSESVSKKVQISEAAQAWGAVGLGMQKNNLDDESATGTIFQKIKIKIAGDKEEMQKKYKSVSGKVYLYAGTEEQGTPCCQSCGGPECYEGTLISTLSYSLSNGGTIINSMVTSDVGEWDNNAVNDTLNGLLLQACYTVDNIEFM